MQTFQTNELKFIVPEWPAPSNINAFSTTRLGGVSHAPYNGFNLAIHVEDELEAVTQNRALLQSALKLPSSPFWLDQRHTTKLIELTEDTTLSTPVPPIADASWTTQKEAVSLVMTADCLPLLVTNKTGSLVSAIHAGWKGLADGIVEKSINRLPEMPENLLVWIGPAIGANAFQVGQDVFDAFVDEQPHLEAFFLPDIQQPSKYRANLPGLVKTILNQLGVQSVYGGELCTYEMDELFYSYRREGKTGRMASLIWIAKVSN